MNKYVRAVKSLFSGKVSVAAALRRYDNELTSRKPERAALHRDYRELVGEYQRLARMAVVTREHLDRAMDIASRAIKIIDEDAEFYEKIAYGFEELRPTFEKALGEKKVRV